MVNHVRTLLLNVAQTDLASPGYAYIPAGYQPIADSALLQKVRQSLFGSNPDSTMRHYRAVEILRCVHSTELASLSTVTDSRISYLPFDRSILALRQQRASVTTLAAASGQELSVLGDRDTAESDALKLVWNLEITSGTEIVIGFNGETTSTETYSVTDNLSSVVPLANSNLAVRFSPGVGARWTVTSVARPRLNLAEVVESLDQSLVPQELDDLFGQTGQLRDAWTGSDRLALRVGALGLALAAATETWRAR